MRVIVSGYLGFGNAGDEAALAGIIVGMREAAAEVDFTVLSGNPAATARTHGVAAIGRLDFRSLNRALAGAHLLISGGGNLFQDATSARSCLYYLAVIGRAAKARVPVMVLGQGIGPLRRRWLRGLVRRYLHRVSGIAVRDSESARELERMGIQTAVRVAGDLSLAMPLPGDEQLAEAWRELGVSDAAPMLAIAPRTWRVRGLSGEFSAGLASAIKRAAAQLQPPARIVCFPMQRPQDEAACASLAQSTDGITAREERPPAVLAGMIGGARAVVGMRLHALIFAAMGGAPPVAVSYDPKVQAFMADIGLMAAAEVGELDEGRLAAAIVEAWNADDAAREALRRTMGERRESVRDALRWAAEVARKPEATGPLRSP